MDFDTIVNTLKIKADIAYLNYLNQLKKDECLGLEQKVKAGIFSQVEMDSYRTAAIEYGKHQAFLTAIHMLYQQQENI